MARVVFVGLLLVCAHAEARAEEIPAAASHKKQSGDELAAQGRYDEAVRAYREAIALAPRYHLAYEGLGRVYFGRGQYAQAIDAFRKALEARPDYALGHYNLAYALRKAGRFREAIAAYEEYRKHRPDDPDTHFGLAESHKALGQKAQAIEHYAAYAKKEKRPSEASWVELARKEIERLRRETADEAARKRAVESARADVPPLPPRAEAPAAATPAPRAEVPPAPTPPLRAEEPATPPLPPRAEAPSAATPAPRAGVPPAPTPPPRAEAPPAPPPLPPPASVPSRPRITPLDATALGLLREGDRAYARRRYRQALRAYLRAAERSPASPHVHYKLGRTYLKLKRHGAAVQAFERVLILSPDDEAARIGLEAARRAAH